MAHSVFKFETLQLQKHESNRTHLLLDLRNSVQPFAVKMRKIRLYGHEL